MWKADRGVVMEHKPMRGAEPLDPPSPELARQYLEEVRQVEQRLAGHVDLRAAAWRSILASAQLAVAFTVLLLVTRVGGFTVPLLPVILVIGQIGAGFAERHGAQWRVRGAQWVIVALLAAAFGISFIWLTAEPADRPLWAFLIPGALFLASGGWIAAVQLRRARGAARLTAERPAPMPSATRIATAVLGIVLGCCAAFLGIDDELTSSLAYTAILIAVPVWMLLWRFDFGLPALGRYWSWRQEAAYGLSLAIVLALCLLRAYTDGALWHLTVAGGVIAALALGISALIGGTRREHG